MYTYQTETDKDTYIIEHLIFDPEGDWICTVESEFQAKLLLSHLNRAEDSLMRHLMEG